MSTTETPETTEQQTPEKPVSILDRAKPIIDIPDTLNLSLYGPPGCGKTSNAATAAQYGDVLLIDVERGTRSLRNPDNPAFKYLNRIHGLPVDLPEEVEEILWEAREQVLDGSFNYKTIIVDTVSEYSDRKLTAQLKRNHLRDSNKNPYLASQADYKERNEYMRRLFMGFRDLPINFIMLAHDRDDKDEVTGQITTGPAVSPGVQGAMESMSDVLGYIQLSSGNDEAWPGNVMRVRTNGRVRAKTRISGLDTLIENPTLEMIFEANKEQQNV